MIPTRFHKPWNEKVKSTSETNSTVRPVNLTATLLQYSADILWQQKGVLFIFCWACWGYIFTESSPGWETTISQSLSFIQRLWPWDVPSMSMRNMVWKHCCELHRKEIKPCHCEPWYSNWWVDASDIYFSCASSCGHSCCGAHPVLLVNCFISVSHWDTLCVCVWASTREKVKGNYEQEIWPTCCPLSPSLSFSLSPYKPLQVHLGDEELYFPSLFHGYLKSTQTEK